MGKEVEIQGFENMPKLLKEKYYVVHNNDFMLRTIDSELIGIDPYNIPKDLSNEQEFDLKRRIVKECIDNPWYFFRTIIRLPNDQQAFDVHVGNLTLIRLMINNANIICKLPRQSWVTTTVAGMMLWESMFRSVRESITVFGKSNADKEVVLDKVAAMANLLPDYIIKSIMFPRYKNRIEFFTGTSVMISGRYPSEYINLDYPGFWFVDDAEFSNFDPEYVQYRENPMKWRVFRIHAISDRLSNEPQLWRKMIRCAFPWHNALHALPDKAIQEIAQKKVIYLNCDAYELYDDAVIETLKKSLDEDSFNREVLLRDDFDITK